MSQFVYQGPMGQGGESRALAQDQYEEDQRILNKSQNKTRGTPQGYQRGDPYMNEDDQFAPMSSPTQGNMGQRRGTVLRVSSAQKKRPPAQGMQGQYEEEETQRQTLKYDQVYPSTANPQTIDPFNNDYQGVTPYRKSQRKSDNYPLSEKTGSGFTRPQKNMPRKIDSYGAINVEDDDQQYPGQVTPRTNTTNMGPSNFANPMAADSRQQIRSQVMPSLPINPQYSQPRRMTDQQQRPLDEYDDQTLLSPRQRDELVNRHQRVIQNEIESLQNESKSYRQLSSPRVQRKSSPIRNRYAEDQAPPTNYADIKGVRQPRQQLTDVKSIKVAKSRSGSNIRQRPENYRPLNPSYSKSLKVINAKVEQTDNEFVEQPFGPKDHGIGVSPRAYQKTPMPQRNQIEDEDVISIQNQINMEYENKLKQVNDEAQMKLKEVQDEHRSILAKTQELYSKKKEVDDLERQFNAMNKQLINQPQSGYKQAQSEMPMLHRPQLADPNNQSLNTQQMSFLNASGRQMDRGLSNDRPSHYVKSGMRPPQRDRDASRNTFQMLNELSDYDNRSASRGRYSRMSSGVRDEFPENNFSNNNPMAQGKGKNAMKLREMYKEFCDTINQNRQRNPQTYQYEVNLHDVLMDLHLIGPDTETNLERQATEGTEVTAISTDNVRVQRGKFNIPLRSDVQQFDEHTKEDVLKNLFKILCGIMNMPLKQRGINIMDSQILKQYVDSINFNLQDNDLILLNQMATIKGLANRKAYSLTEQQLVMIHQKFKNLSEQRNETVDFQQKKRGPMPQIENVDQQQYGGRKGSTVIMGDRVSDIDRYTPLYVKMSPGRANKYNNNNNNNNNFPQELQFHELEESREFRQSRQAGMYPNERMGGGNKPYVKSKRPPPQQVSNVKRPDRRSPVRDVDDPIERFRPMEYRRPDGKPQPYEEVDDEEPTFVEDEDQYQPTSYMPPQRKSRPPVMNPREMDPDMYEDPRYQEYERPRHVKSKRPGDRSNPRGGRSSSMIGRGSQFAPETSPSTQKRRYTSPKRMDNIQDFLNSQPVGNTRRANPNQSGVGRQFKDVRKRSGAKNSRAYEEEMYIRGSRGGDPRGDPRDRNNYRSPDSRYSDYSPGGRNRDSFNPRNMNHGGYNL